MTDQNRGLTRDGFFLRIIGSVRGTDEAGHNAFEVSFEDGRTFYGEWQTKWLDDEVHFEVEVIRFGYRNKENIPNKAVGAVESFTIVEEKLIRNLLSILFNCRDLTEKKSPFSLNGAIFNKIVNFKTDWINISA